MLRILSRCLAVFLLLSAQPIFAATDTTKQQLTKFELKGPDRLTVDLAQQKGKVIFVNFWSLACIPCRQEMPSINKLKEYYDINTDVAFYSICLDDNIQAATDYFKEKSYSLKIYSVDGPVPEIVFRGELPTTVIIDKQGRVVFLKEEKEDYSDKKFTDMIDRLRQAP
jgi:thiol-disulfide isomerase/thioredoxin